MFSNITFSKMIKIIFQQYKQSINIWIFMSPESLRWPIVIRLSLSSVVQASSYNILLHLYMYNQGQLLQYQFLVCIKLLIDKSTPNSKMYKLTTPNASWTVPNIQKMLWNNKIKISKKRREPYSVDMNTCIWLKCPWSFF